MNESPWSATCPECGAELSSPDEPCWLCGRALEAERETALSRNVGAPRAGRGPAEAGPPKAAPQPFSYSLSTAMLLMTLAVVWLGLLAAAPGLAIFACILLAPVLVRTAMVVKRREAAGRTVSPGKKVALAATSLVVSLVIVTVTAVAAVGTFCGLCLGMYSMTGGREDESQVMIMMVIAGLAALVVLILLGRWFGKWVKRRYRRDIGEE